MKYKAVIFDFDMTLADSAKVIYVLLNECAEDFGYKKQSFDYLYPVIGNTHEIMIRRVTGETDKKKLQEIIEHYRKLCRNKMAEKTVLFDGVKDTLVEMKSEGIKLGLFSLKLTEVLLDILRINDISEVFASVVGCLDVKAPKPDPSGLILSLEKLNVSKTEALYVGDSLVDAGAAKNAGIDFCAMLKGSTKKEEFDSSFTRNYYSNIEDIWNDLK